MINEDSKERVLERFMKEHFDFNALCKACFFTKDMKGKYQLQADRVCQFFGYKTVYEYGSKEISCHITYVNGTRPEGEGFVTTLPNIYD